MADRIKGITVEIGGDTQGLDKALKGVNDTSRDLQKELRDVSRLLKFDPNNAELMAQKQKLLNDQIENTSKKLNQLKDVEAEVQAKFDAGEIGAEQYRAFQRELQDTAQSLRHTQNQLADLKSEQEAVQSSTKQLDNLFAATNSTLQDYADTLGNKLVRSIQNGTASSRDLQKAFDMISRGALGASTDVAQVRQALQRLESGEASIQGVRRQLQQMSSDANDAQGSVKDLGGELTNLAAGAAAGIGIDKIIEKSMDISKLDTTIDISFQVPEESKKSVKAAVQAVQAYGIDAETALAAVQRQWKLTGNLTDEENTKLIKQEGTIVSAYGEIDLNELITESNEMAKGFKISNEEALGMTKALLDMGFPPDQLDIISEYGQQLSRAGYDATEIQNIFAAGIETGTWNIDVLMDGLKEGRIVLAEFGQGVDDTTTKLLEGTGISATKLQEWGKSVAAGGDEGKAAMTDVAKAVMGIDDATKRNQVGVKLFGTLWEENGGLIGDTLINATTKTADLAAQQQTLNDNVATLDASPQVALNQALTDMWNALQPLLGVVASFIGIMAQWIQQNPTLAAAIAAVVVGIGILIGIMLVLAPILTTITGLAGALGVSIGAIAAPVLIAIAIIAAIIAIGVLLWKNWDTIMAWASKLGKSIAKAFQDMWDGATKWMGNLVKDVQRLWNNVMDFFEGIDLASIGKNIIQGLINGITSMGEKVKRAASNIANGIGEKVKSILKLGSPSKVLIGMGEDAGDGLAIGMENSLKNIKDKASAMAHSAMPEIKMQHQAAAPSSDNSKTMTVNINSPKALNVREAKSVWNRTMKQMQLEW